MSEPALRLDFHLDGNGVKMDKYGNGHFDTSLGQSLCNTQGGPGGMSSDLMDEINKAFRIFVQKRNFRVGSVIMHLKGGNKNTIDSIDYEAGRAKLQNGGSAILAQMTTVEW